MSQIVGTCLDELGIAYAHRSLPHRGVFTRIGAVEGVAHCGARIAGVGNELAVLHHDSGLIEVEINAFALQARQLTSAEAQVELRPIGFVELDVGGAFTPCWRSIPATLSHSDDAWKSIAFDHAIVANGFRPYLRLHAHDILAVSERGLAVGNSSEVDGSAISTFTSRTIGVVRKGAEGCIFAAPAAPAQPLLVVMRGVSHIEVEVAHVAQHHGIAIVGEGVGHYIVGAIGVPCVDYAETWRNAAVVVGTMVGP